MRKKMVGFIFGFVFLCMSHFQVFAENKSSDIFHGEVTFQYYCSACHGIYGQGDGPSAKGIYKSAGVAPRNLADENFQKSRTDVQLIKAISGGVHSKTSKKLRMPAWGNTFSKKEIKQIVSYVRTLTKKKVSPNPKDIEMGKGIFVTRCSLCHGLSGKGDGPYITTMKKKNKKFPNPPDFTDAVFVQTLSDTEISETIYKGGGHSGKSAVMPGWWKILSKNDIHNLMVYVRSFSK